MTKDEFLFHYGCEWDTDEFLGWDEVFICIEQTFGCQLSKLQAENEKLKKVLIIIRDRFSEKIDSNESYLKEMQRISELPEHEAIYDKAQSNILETEQILIWYKWFYNKCQEALKEII